MLSSRLHGAITVILREHEQLSAVIDGMRRYVHLLAAAKPVPGLMVLRAMLYYIREYPAQVHHPKEERYLFAPLRDATSELDGVLDELETQHARGDGMLTNLEHALTRYELKGAPALAEDRRESWMRTYLSVQNSRQWTKTAPAGAFRSTWRFGRASTAVDQSLSSTAT